jgi:transcriptional regulator with XRE-family HTH domain
VRQLDDAREEQGLSKAELARRTGRAEFLRRLFTAQTPNPTLETVVEVAAALDLELSLTGCVSGKAAPGSLRREM